MLTCALAGGVVTGNPNQPVDREDVIREAVGAAQAGASILHIHARSTTGEMTQSPEDYIAIKEAVREQAGDVVLNFTTGGKLGTPAQERRRSLQAQPEVASLNCGSINFGPDDVVFLNPRSLIGELAEEMAERGIVPEYECFDIGMAVTAAGLATAQPGAKGMMHMVLGVIGGAPATVGTISLFAELVPEGIPWMVTAIGRHNFPMMAVTLALGGHIRTGLEDVSTWVRVSMRSPTRSSSPARGRSARGSDAPRQRPRRRGRSWASPPERLVFKWVAPRML